MPNYIVYELWLFHRHGDGYWYRALSWGNPPDYTMATVVLYRKFILHKSWARFLSLNGCCTHFRDRTLSPDEDPCV